MTKYLGVWHSLRLIQSTEEITLLTINARYNYSACQYLTKAMFGLERPQLPAAGPAERQLSGSEPLFPVLQAGAAVSLAKQVTELILALPSSLRRGGRRTDLRGTHRLLHWRTPPCSTAGRESGKAAAGENVKAQEKI